MSSQGQSHWEHGGYGYGDREYGSLDRGPGYGDRGYGYGNRGYGYGYGYGDRGGYSGSPGNPYHYGENRERFGGGSPGYGGQGAYEGGQGTYGPGQHNQGGGYRGSYADDIGGSYAGGGYGGMGGDRWDAYEGNTRSRREMGRHAGKGPKGYQRDWNRVKDDVCDVLERDDRVDASNIDVRIENGEVTLSGTVEDREQKRHAERIVERVHGVRDVQNQIRVQPQYEPNPQGQQQSSQQTRGMSSASGGDASRENNEEQGRGSAQSGRSERNPRAT